MVGQTRLSESEYPAGTPSIRDYRLPVPCSACCGSGRVPKLPDDCNAASDDNFYPCPACRGFGEV